MSETQWFTVKHRWQTKKIISTYGVTDGKLSAIAYHYDFRDKNLDGKVKWHEKLYSHITMDQKNEFDMMIGEDIMLKATDDNFPLSIEEGAKFRQKAFLKILGDVSQLTEEAINFVYFKTIVGQGVSKALTAAGVEGIKKLVYSQAIKSILNGVIR